MPHPASERETQTPRRASAMLFGSLCALLCWFVGQDLGLLDVFPLWRGVTATIFLAAGLGGALGLTRARPLLPWGAALSVLGWMIVAFTPLSSALARPLIVAQAPERTDAVVVLLASIQSDDDFGTPSLERTLHGLELMRQGLAPRLILTQGFPPEGSHRVAASRLMAGLRVSFPLQVVGPVRDTHDEALAVSQLARKNGWKRILLVTSPLHSKRASLVFAATGLQVVSVPCRESSYDLENLNAPIARVKAFGAAVHELLGLRAYRARGWI